MATKWSSDIYEKRERYANLGYPTWQQKVFVPPTYQMSRNLFDPTVKYCTIGPYLQNRRHQRRSFSLSRRDTQSQKRIQSTIWVSWKLASSHVRHHVTFFFFGRVLVITWALSCRHHLYLSIIYHLGCSALISQLFHCCYNIIVLINQYYDYY